MAFTKANTTVLDLTNVPVPIQGPHAANKQYVDDVAAAIYTAIEDIAGSAGAPHTLQGAQHTNVATTTPTLGQVLSWNGSVWAPATVSSGSSGSYLPLSGGTLSGFLTLHADPTSGMHAATKNYVEARISAAISGISGGSGGTPVSYVGSSYITVAGNVISLNTTATNGLYSAAGHTHAGVYASAVHSHPEYSPISHSHAGIYADVGHSHSNYATTAQLSGYSPTSHTHGSANGNVVVLTGIVDATYGANLPVPSGFTSGQCRAFWATPSVSTPAAQAFSFTISGTGMTVPAAGGSVNYIVVAVK